MTAAAASASKTHGPLRAVFDVVGSLGFAMFNLACLFLVTYFGTLYQVDNGLHKAQVDYFESWFVAHHWFDLFGVQWRLPLPGGQLIMWMMSINLLVGGILKVVGRGTRVIGILIGHVGILLLIFGGWLRLVAAEEGHVTLYEEDQVQRVIGGTAESSVYQHYIEWELAVTRPADGGDGKGREWSFPQELFSDAGSGNEMVTLRAETMPFSIQVRDYMINARPRKVVGGSAGARAAEGYWLAEQPVDSQAERNAAGLYAAVPEAKNAPEAILWGFTLEPWTVVVADQIYLIELRKRRMNMPWSIRLADFIKEEHPGTMQPRRFASDIVVVDNSGVERDVHISMNRPFRDDGFVVYQASWGPPNAPPGTPLFSTLAVSRNPADRIPWIGVVVVAVGLMVHFGMKFIRFMGRQERRAARSNKEATS